MLVQAGRWCISHPSDGLPSPSSTERPRPLIGLAVILAVSFALASLTGETSRVGKVAARVLITEEAPFTAQAFIRDLADWLRQPRASTNGPPQGLREAVQGSFGPNIGYAMLIKMYEGANGKDGTAERRPGCLHGITRADDQPPSITLTRVAGPG